jgi:hypothetical protein
MTKVSVSVPAVCTNLGSGYHVLGLALNLRTVVEMSLTGDDQLRIVSQGEGADALPANFYHPVAVAATRLFQEVEEAPPGLSIVCNNRIPLRVGLSSRAAMTVAGLVGANNLLGGPLPREALIELAARLSDHPEATATALNGGLGIWARGGGPPGDTTRAQAPRGGRGARALSPAVQAPPPALLARARPLDDPGLQAFLQLPPELPARVGELARRIVRGKSSLYEKVLAVERHLRTNYRYSLRLTHTPGLEPVDEFLFVTRRGHCEYFASAMALLLRSLGIHARNVNGFAGGSWNHYGNYLAVRQGDAHSWVEVLFPNLGWVTFDPTPPTSVGPAPTGILASLEEMMDAMRMRWYRHVIEYDLRQQVSLLHRAQGWLASGGARRGSWSALAWIAAAVLLASAVALLARRRWRRQRTTRPGEARGHPGRLPRVSQLYAHMLKLLARAGQVKPPGSTPQEFALELRRRGFAGPELVERLTGWYYLARYGGNPGASTEAEREMTTLLRELQQTLRPR